MEEEKSVQWNFFLKTDLHSWNLKRRETKREWKEGWKRRDKKIKENTKENEGRGDLKNYRWSVLRNSCTVLRMKEERRKER